MTMAEDQNDRTEKPNPLHVLHVVSGDLWAGAEVQVWQLLRAAAREPGLRISAVVLNPGRLADELGAAGVAVTILDESKLSFLQIARELVRHVRRTRPQVIHTHRRKEHMLGAIAARAIGAGLVGTVHGRGEFGHEPWNLRQWLLRTAERLVLARAHDRLIAVADDLAEELPGGPQHVVVIPNSIDVAATRAVAAADYPTALDGKRLRLMFIGRLVPVKQVDKLIAMIRMLEEQKPGIYGLEIVGDGPLRSDLETIAEGAASSAITFHGFVPNPQRLLTQADALMFASAHEGLPMTALEALSLGVPIVSPPIASVARLISESGSGLCAASSNPEDLTDAVLRFFSSPRNRESPAQPALPGRYEIREGLARTRRLWESVSGISPT